jgi:hypothetical protein
VHHGDGFRPAAGLVVQLLNAASISNLPIRQNDVRAVLNTRTANALGFEMPVAILAEPTAGEASVRSWSRSNGSYWGRILSVVTVTSMSPLRPRTV